MNSPFPGMDPFIEGCGLCGDFHGHLIEDIYRHLAEVAPARYVVRTGEREFMEIIEADRTKRKPFVPDVKVTQSERSKKAKATDVIVVAEPQIDIDRDVVLLRAFIEEEQRETFVEIFDVESGHRLVTCIEVLSPTNKQSGTKGRKLYRRKRKTLILGDVNFIEIDLLRGGQRMPMVDDWPHSPYTLLVSRTGGEGACRVWPAHSLKRVPAIPVPLAKPDPDLSIDLQPMIEAIYERSRYAGSIDYRRPIDPPLKKDEAAWLKKQLRNHRSSSRAED